ncbi:MAG: tetraacyldisaccharide 4'-kinase [Gammaproteobacteria bacterium]|nr:tetraacyldisaccharide 4'-kinase [Gammaproteobacteria bacterium]
MSFLEQAWYKKAGWLILLWPLGTLVQLLAAIRRALQSVPIRPDKVSVPVVVIGNIAVGGTGKTPLVIALINYLKQQGYKPGVISRGYGGKGASYPMLIDAIASPRIAGDEAVLIARQCDCPVVIDPDRNSALQYLASKAPVDVVLSDDGLQHYKLYRDIEIAVIDGQRMFGNGFCLPAGPLREPVKRLDSVDFVVINGANASAELRNFIPVKMEPKFLINMLTNEKRPFSGAPFKMGNTLQAVSGIGNPQRFYDSLAKLPYPIKQYSFPDHHPFTVEDFDQAAIDEHHPVVMTEKDAVKCVDFAKAIYGIYSLRWNCPRSF